MLQIEHINEATVLTFPQHELWKDDIVRAVGEELTELIETLGPRHYILSFLNVVSLSSLMFGRLIALGKMIRQAGGRLTLCSLTPDLVERFVAMRLDRLFRICASEEESLGL